MDDADQGFFESLYQAFVRRGGLDETRVVSEEVELLYRRIDRHVPEKCSHGKTLLTCPECYFNTDRNRKW